MTSSSQSLLDLAARVEAAEASEQREMLLSAFKALPRAEEYYWQRDDWRRFDKMLDAEAFESAAILLVDPRALWSVGSMEDGPFARLCWPQQDGGFVGGYIAATAATPALALTAAALRARAQEQSA